MAEFLESKTQNPGRAAMEFEKSRLSKLIDTWNKALSRIRYDNDAVNEHKSWIAEAKEQIDQLNDWIKNPVDVNTFMRQIKAYDLAYKSDLYAKIFEKKPILS